MSVWQVALATISLWRLCSLFTSEEGPLGIFQHLRERLGILHDEQGRIEAIPDDYLAKLFSCIWCLSVVLGVPWAVLWILVPWLMEWVTLPLTLSAGVIAISKAVKYG